MQNQEHQLKELAEKHNQNLVTLTNLVGQVDDALAAVREEYSEAVRQALVAEAKSRVALHNAVAGSEGSLWKELKTRVVGRVRYGWRRLKARLRYKDEQAVITHLEKNLSKEDLERVVKIDKKLVKNELGKLPAKRLGAAGIELVAAGEEVVVADTASGMQKSIARLRADGWEDAA